MAEAIQADVCEHCDEAEHVHYCPKPPGISVGKWSTMNDEERLKSEFEWRKSLLALKKKAVTVNENQKLYVIPEHGGYSCLGFDVAYRKARAVYDWLVESCARYVDHRVPTDPPNESLKGTLAGYDDYMRLMHAGAEFAHRTKMRCPADLHPKLIGLEGKKVEVTMENGDKKKFRVGKSTGWFPIHLVMEGNKKYGDGVFYDEVYTKVEVIQEGRW